MSLYAADGSWNVTVVDGSTFTGLYAPDGSYNVVEVDGTSIAGLYAPCGAYNVYVSDGTYIGFYHPSGAINVSVSPYETGTVRVTAVSGSLGSSLTDIIVSVEAIEPVTNPPDLAFTFTGDIAENDVIECGINAQQVDFSSAPLSAGEIVSGTFTLIDEVIASGATVVYCRVNRAGSFSPWVASPEFTVPAASGTAGEAIGLLLLLTKAA